jgi:branched-chain amino acid transport system substrate-binding protein
MKLRTLLVAPAALALVVVALSTGCSSGGAGAKNELVVGEYGSLTGSDATFGQSTRMGVELALAELVQAKEGKIGGLPVRVVSEDDQGKPEEAANAVQKLLNQDQVVSVIGEVASSRSLAAAPICQQAGVPMVSPSSTNPRVTEVGDFIFRMCFIDPFQGTVMAKFASTNLNLKRVAILKDIKSDYSVGLAQFFAAAFKGAGGQIVAEQAYQAGDQDFSSQLTAIKARNPEAIFVPGYYTEVGLIARKAKELGLAAPLLGGDGWESEQLLAIGGEALNGSYYSNHFAVDNPDPRLQDFLAKFKTRFGKEPDAIAGLAYDAASVLFSCMEKMASEDPTTFAGLSSSQAGSPARKAACAKLRDLVAATQGYPGVTGSITLDAHRNATKPAVVLEIKGGKKVYNTTINP